VPAREGREELTEHGAVTDPVKMLNVYPIGHCGTLGPALEFGHFSLDSDFRFG
jgi:hypothetical protein